ncbi:MAG: hypothetical protein ABJA35_08880 [Parafilimonas sp.]
MKINFINCFKLQSGFIFFILIFLSGCTKTVIKEDEGSSFDYNPKQIAHGVLIGDVYNTNNFAAFTDIAYYDNAWYIVFRAGTIHVGGLKGQIKVLKSTDAVTWTVDYIIKNDTLDLRDPKLFIDTLNNKLYTQFTGITTTENRKSTYSFLSLHNINGGWGTPGIITNNNARNEKYNFWRSIYFNGKTYCAAYRIPIYGGYTNDDICLFTNDNNFETYDTIGKLNLGKSPSEATVRFAPDNKMYFLIRREVAHVAMGFSSPADYSKVTWIDDPLSIRLSSPNFLFYNGRLLICGRDQDALTFKFFSYNPETNKVEKEITFPSGVETGYGGMSFNPANKDELLISYYVINGNTSSIKLIRMDLKTFLQ